MHLKSIIMAAVLFAAGVPSAMGAVLDQSYQPAINTDFYIHGPYYLAQTVTAGMSGYLTEIDLPVTHFSDGGTTPWQFSIQQVSSGVPTWTILATQKISETAIPSTYTPPLAVDFSSPAFLTAGEQYAIVVNSPGYSEFGSGAGAWGGSSSNPYSGGHVFVTGVSQNFFPYTGGGSPAFETFMEAPEPSPVLLIVLISVFGMLLVRNKATVRGTSS